MSELIAVAGPDASAVHSRCAELARDLVTRPGTPLADVAQELRPANQPYRRAFVARDTTQAARLLRKPGAAGPVTDRPVHLLFPGVGDHHAGMCTSLYRDEPVFRHWLDTCAGLLDTDILEVLRSQEETAKPAHPSGIDLAALLGRRDGPTNAIDRTAVAQPLVFAVEYALAKLLLHWGIRPAGLAGYSVGEYVAATVAGVFTLPDACTVIARRAALIEELPRGAMTVVMLGEAELIPKLGPELSLAAVDGPALCVAAGPLDAVEALEKQLTEDGVASLRATASHAFHSTMLDPVAEALAALLGEVSLRPPRLPLLSNVTGAWLTGEQATDPGYWVRHTCATVRFHDQLTTLWRDAANPLVVETGAGQLLGGLAAQHPGAPADPTVFATLPAAGTATDDRAAVLTTAGLLWQAGADLDWSGLTPAEG